jgi:hypothetical protein
VIARAERGKIRLQTSWDDPEVYLPVLEELIAANENYDAHQTDLGAAALRPFAERLAAAEADMDDMFAEVLTIEQAESLHARLYGAIIAAKAESGRFTYNEDAD